MASRTSRWAPLSTLAVLGAAVLALAALRDTRPVHPNILFVTIDTLRADHCSSYGYGRLTTPNLDRLAREGVRFSRVYAPMPTTLPSHAAMFTGRRPSSLSVLRNGARLGDEARTLAEALRSFGYDTAAVVSSFPVHHRFGLAQGFAFYDDDFADGESRGQRTWEGLEAPQEFSRRADATRERALAWLGQRGHVDGTSTRPFFLWVHFFDPHHPYDPPQEHALFASGATTEKARLLARYDGEVHFADHELGRLLEALRSRLDNTLVIATGDHGEGLGDHGYLRHGLFLYDEAVRVPLVVHWPRKIPASRTVDETVELLDLAPTVLGLLGLPGASSEGRDLAPFLLRRRALGAERPVFLDRRAFDTTTVDGIEVRGPKRAVVYGGFKYIEAPDERTRELYDLLADPAELENLVERRPAEARTLGALLRESGAPIGARNRLPADVAERLRALGYVQ